MTHVFVTRTGARYHASGDCPSFADSEAVHGRPVIPREAELHGLAESPCSVCWPRTTGYDAWRQFELEVERTGDSPFEADFVRLVLRYIPELQPSDVSTQRKSYGHSGHVYFLDFVIQSTGGYRVAVEIDGIDKAPGRKTPDEIRRNVDEKRADLVAAGWRVLNFTNERVVTRSDQCRVELRDALQPAVVPRDADTPVTAPAPEVRPSDVPPMRPITWAESMAHQQAKAASAPPRPPRPQVAGTPRKRRRGSARWWLAGAAGVAAAATIYAVAQPTDQNDDIRPVDGACPESAPIKGNIGSEGDKIYHRPGWQYYDATNAESCFETEADAEAAGFRASQIR